jgi:hypothetical protein
MNSERFANIGRNPCVGAFRHQSFVRLSADHKTVPLRRAVAFAVFSFSVSEGSPWSDVRTAVVIPSFTNGLLPRIPAGIGAVPT